MSRLHPWFLGIRQMPLLWLYAKPSRKSMDLIEVGFLGGWDA